MARVNARNVPIVCAATLWRHEKIRTRNKSFSPIYNAVDIGEYKKALSNAIRTFFYS
jgi:hypothetical protein